MLGEHADTIGEKLLEHGALLLRGFGINDVARFESVVAGLSRCPLDYMYRSTPRTSVGKNVFTATEFPPPLEIPLHNENAYQRDWPLKLAFCCIEAAATGGQTSIADMRTVHSREAFESLQEHVGDKLLVHTVRQSIAYAESAERAISIYDHRPDLGTDYLHVAEELLRRLGLNSARDQVATQLAGLA